ncbi:MAG TPA: flagellar biosynthetic protein FliO [Gaiellales bacterium]|nr:flagellar biosynthetic protein FliO [Gaiellales bacterium]
MLVLLVCLPASSAASGFRRDQTPLPADLTGGGSSHAALNGSGTGGAAIHMLFGLALVLGLIYALYRLLRRSSDKNEKEKVIRGDDWMSVIASTPLAPSRSVHLIRVGEEIVLVGSGEQGVTPIRVYSAEEARQLRIDPREFPALDAAPTGAADPSFLSALLESLRRMTAR